MSSCERTILQLMRAAMLRRQTIDSKGLKKLAQEASKDDDEHVRIFWTLQRLTFTLTAIEDLRDGYRCESLISTWFLPFVQDVEERRGSRFFTMAKSRPLRLLRSFARHHQVHIR